MIARLQERMLDLVFPRRCVNCGTEGSWACLGCLQQVTLTRWQGREAGLSPLLGLLSFKTRLVRELLHHLKYNGIREAGTSLLEIVQQGITKEEMLAILGQAIVLVPVPLSMAKLKLRGYNQAAVVAELLGQWLEVPVWSEALGSSGHLKSQVGKRQAERQASAKQRFTWSGKQLPAHLLGRRLVLVDDVCTTGSTLQACAELLQAHSSFLVAGLVLAHNF